METAGIPLNEVTRAVQRSRNHIIGALVSALVHTPTGATLRFEFLESGCALNRVSVSTPRTNAPQRSAAWWEEQLEHVLEWLKNLDESR